MAFIKKAAEPTSGGTAGLLATLQRLLATFIDILHVRIELLTTELEEELERIHQVAIYGLASLLFLGLGLIVASALLVIILWEPYRLYVLSGLTILYLGISVASAMVVRHKLKTRPHLLSATLSELGKDRDRLASPL